MRPIPRLVRGLTLASIMALAHLSYAKPLYILADLKQYPGKLTVYDILGPGQLELRGHYNIPQWQEGSVGIAIDSDGGFLFITYEASNWIQVINTQTMAPAGICIVNGAENLAGIVYDHHKRLLYCAERGKDRLFILEWNGQQLRPRTNNPIVLGGANAFGIALDETNDLLYVANATNAIHVYGTSDWSRVRTINLTHNAISVAIDHRRQILYTGAGYSFKDTSLVRYDLNTNTEDRVQIDPAAGVIGIAVDDQSGHVYLTTGLDQAYGGDDLVVLSSSLELLTKIHLGGNPTGLVLPLSEFGLPPVQITKTIVDGAIQSQGMNYTSPGNYLTYELCITNDPCNEAVTGLVVRDVFPPELEFLKVEGMVDSEGTYDQQSRVFTYRRPVLYPGTTVCLRITAQVLPSTPPGLTITNTATASADNTDSSTTTATVLTGFRPMQISKSIVPDPNLTIADQMVYVHPGQTLTYQIVISNPDNETPIPDLVLIDTLPQELEFVSWRADEGLGIYDPCLSAYTHVISPVQPKATYTFDLTARVKTGVTGGTVIKNVAIINGRWAPQSKAECLATVGYQQLQVTKSIIWPTPTDDQIVQVVVGGHVTYHLTITNLSEAAVTNVSVTDALPPSLDPVSVNPAGSYDPSNRTCNWLLPSLMPGEDKTLELVAMLNSTAQAGQTVENQAIAVSDQTRPATGSAWLVAYLPPIEAGLQLIYSSPVCKDCSGLIQAVVSLPSEVRLADVNLASPLIMEPGSARASIQTLGGKDGAVKIRAFFEPGPLLNATSGYGPVAVTVRGWLRSGRPFVGQAQFLVTRAMR
ncbi:MAG: hypothetical protein QHH07_07645 [Sedimentisphaerales bacterium]|nr:hypothetical protein [Sedimentisphaerales bacterium]